jgi:hypothetical protein
VVSFNADVILTILYGASIEGNPDYKPDVFSMQKGDIITVKIWIHPAIQLLMVFHLLVISGKYSIHVLLMLEDLQ